MLEEQVRMYINSTILMAAVESLVLSDLEAHLQMNPFKFLHIQRGEK